MKNQWKAVLLTAVFMLTVFTSFYLVYADDISWQYDNAAKTLYITGSGNMEDYSAGNVPWNACLNQMEKVVVEDGVQRVGKYAFAGASKLSDVVLADSVTVIGEYAFASCPLLNGLTLGSEVIEIENNDCSFAYNGATLKERFVLSVQSGSYALFFAYKNNVSFVCEDVRTGILHVSLQKGMTAYFPYTANYSGSYRFYSVSKHDTLGYIYDADGRQLAYNDDHSTEYDASMGSTDFGITQTLTKGERYFLGVRIFNPSLKAHFDVYFVPVEYTVSGTLYPMAAPDGTASELPLVGAQMDGVALTNGAFTKTVSGLSETVIFSCDGVTLEHTFCVEDGDDITLTMMMCDSNHDGIVNAKDYAYMLKSDSPYLPLFDSFINYTY